MMVMITWARPGPECWEASGSNMIIIKKLYIEEQFSTLRPEALKVPTYLPLFFLRPLQETNNFFF